MAFSGSLTSNAPSLRQQPQTLIDTDVKMPRGIAIDRYNCQGMACERRLYVADVGKRSILSFKLLIANNLPAIAPVEENGPSACAIISNVEATWVTTDSD